MVTQLNDQNLELMHEKYVYHEILAPPTVCPFNLQLELFSLFLNSKQILCAERLLFIFCVDR